jgi:hypothetical protein
VGKLYFGLFNPSHFSPLPLYLPPPFSAAFSAHPVSSSFTGICFTTLLTLQPSLLLSLLPRGPRAAPRLQMCSTSERVCDHACSVCVSIFGSVFHVGENMQPRLSSSGSALHPLRCAPLCLEAHSHLIDGSLASEYCHPVVCLLGFICFWLTHGVQLLLPHLLLCCATPPFPTMFSCSHSTSLCSSLEQPYLFLQLISSQTAPFYTLLYFQLFLFHLPSPFSLAFVRLDQRWW